MKIKTGDEYVDAALREMGVLGKESATLTNDRLAQIEEVCIHWKRQDFTPRRARDLFDRLAKRIRKAIQSRPSRVHWPKGRPAASGREGKRVVG